LFVVALLAFAAAVLAARDRELGYALRLGIGT
jgi:hypothetical protein